MLKRFACAAVLAASAAAAAPVEAAAYYVDAVPVDAQGTYYGDNWIWSNELWETDNGVWAFDVDWITYGKPEQNVIVGAAWASPTDPNIEAFETADDWGDSTMIRDHGDGNVTSWEVIYKPWIQGYDKTGYLYQFTFDTDAPLYAYAYFPTEIDGIPFAEAPAVPEPATWAMFVAGFGLIGAAIRGRRPRQAC